MFIRKSKIKHHIRRAIERNAVMNDRHTKKLLSQQMAHYEELIQRQKDEYEAMLESCDRQIATLKHDLQSDTKMVEMIKFGAKSNNRIAIDLVSWSERFLKSGAEAYQEINAILTDTSTQLRRLEK